MSDFKQTIAVTSVNSENMSRHQMLDWVNNMANGNYKKIEELCSGVAYCQLMEMLFPNCINSKRIKVSAKLEHDYFHNMKLFQGALQRLKLDKTVPVDRLIKGRFQDNFEFLQWFIKFFDSQAPGLENIKSAANAVQPKPIKAGMRGIQKQLKTQPADDLLAEIEQLDSKVHIVTTTRDQAFEKLRKIEVLLTDKTNQEEYETFCKRFLDVLYKNGQNESSDTANEDSMESALND